MTWRAAGLWLGLETGVQTRRFYRRSSKLSCAHSKKHGRQRQQCNNVVQTSQDRPLATQYDGNVVFVTGAARTKTGQTKGGARMELSRPTILLVPGAWHGAWMWEGVERELVARGWPVQTIELPSTAERDGPRAGLYDDAEVVRRRVKEIATPIVIVAHSYGGAVVSEAAAGLPNVRHIVYVCAFALDVGETLLSVIGGEPPPFFDIQDDVVLLQGARELFFHDVPTEIADAAITKLRPWSWTAVNEPLTAAAWRTVPSTYVVCDRDPSFPAAGQEFFASRAEIVRHLPSSHSPALSMPSALTDLIVESAETV
jgi:pimeloyl-ACP methyl ester carboxylesterase